VRRLLSLRTFHAVTFWEHLGKNPDKALSSRREPDQGDISYWHCLRFQHFVVSVGDALKLLDDWHSSEHLATQPCECGVCSNARLNSCSSPAMCRAVLIGLVDAKSPVEWDKRTFPPMPKDTTAEAQSVFGLTFAWDSSAQTVFEISMRSHFVAHFKRVTPLYAAVPDILVNDMLGTYVGTLRRNWADAQRADDAKSVIGDGSSDEGEGSGTSASDRGRSQELGSVPPADFDMDRDMDDELAENNGSPVSRYDSPSDDQLEGEAAGRRARSSVESEDHSKGYKASSSASTHWRLRVSVLNRNWLG